MPRSGLQSRRAPPPASVRNIRMVVSNAPDFDDEHDGVLRERGGIQFDEGIHNGAPDDGRIEQGPGAFATREARLSRIADLCCLILFRFRILHND